MENIKEFLTPGVITLLGLVFFYIVNKVVKKFVSQAEYDMLIRVAKIAVEATEQMAKINEMTPEVKKEHAFAIIQQELDDRNIKVNVPLVYEVIESMVLYLPKVKK